MSTSRLGSVWLYGGPWRLASFVPLSHPPAKVAKSRLRPRPPTRPRVRCKRRARLQESQIEKSVLARSSWRRPRCCSILDARTVIQRGTFPCKVMKVVLTIPRRSVGQTTTVLQEWNARPVIKTRIKNSHACQAHRNGLSRPSRWLGSIERRLRSANRSKTRIAMATKTSPVSSSTAPTMSSLLGAGRLATADNRHPERKSSLARSWPRGSRAARHVRERAQSHEHQAASEWCRRFAGSRS